jgi:hypothetical protein
MPGVPKTLIEHSLNVDPKATPNDNIFVVLPMTDGTPSRRNSPNYSQPASSEKSSILSGLPTPSSSARRTQMSGGCASTTLTSTNTAPRNPSGCRGLTKSSTPRRAATCSTSSTATPGTPDRDQGRRPGEDHVHHPVWHLLLYNNVIRVEERRRYLPVSYPGLFQETGQQEHR